MKPDGSHIRHIRIVSNTHWDREFRRSFEKTRRRLLTMLDVTLDILEGDPRFHSFTMDGHSIMIDDYLEMRPERRPLVGRLVAAGRLIIGPWYTLPEEFSLAGEALVRNLVWGRRRVLAYGGRPGTVAYTPASWGQTGQLPQMFADFGLSRMMFYRGVSHDECDAEWIWEGADGTRVLASRFAVYARYNWYYQVHRAVTRGRTFSKDYSWGQFDDAPLRFVDGLAGEDLAFDLKAPSVDYDRSRLKMAVEDMIAAEGPHFTTDIFLAMNGHDISVAHPLESKVATDAGEEFAGRYTVEHTDLESYWAELESRLDMKALPVLKGERRTHLRKGMWTYLMPFTISARTYLKQMDFDASVGLVGYAEPLASLAAAFGADYPTRYIERGWGYLLSNHTHDANGGCAPDAVCLDIEYRYRKAGDIADIVTEDAVAHIASHLDPAGLAADAMQLLVVNPLPVERDAVVELDLEIPRPFGARSVRLVHSADPHVERQPISWEKSSSFVDNIWDVPTILESDRIRFHARLSRLPSLGWRAYSIEPCKTDLRPAATMITGPNSMENSRLAVTVNGNGTLTVVNKTTGMVYEDLNYLTDQGEVGDAWRHAAPRRDRVYSSLGCSARVAVLEGGPLVACIAAEYEFRVPLECPDRLERSEATVDLPVRVEYRMEADSPLIAVTVTVDNRALDHYLRANFPTGLQTDVSWADSHFDVVSRPIPVPDSSGWVEPYTGTHPLRTFADLTDGRDGLALLPTGLFEYEARDDAQRTLALTLIRACRIRLAVSEEKQTVLSDDGIQCPGVRSFEYGVCVHEGDWREAGLLGLAALRSTPPRAAMIGRGKGALPAEASLVALARGRVHISAVKQADDGDGIVVRLFNPADQPEPVTLTFGRPVASCVECGMNEDRSDPVAADIAGVAVEAGPKKIVTLRVRLAQ